MKVVIVGKGNGWSKAPVCAPGVEIWGVNNICIRRDNVSLTRSVDLAFNMHNMDKHKDHPLFKKTIDYVNKHKIPIVMQKNYDWIPTSIEFPIEMFYRPYFTNSIDYMVAYALYLRRQATGGYEDDDKVLSKIDMYGVVMETGTEYSVQRPSLEYWIGAFEGDGGVVAIHKPTSVCVHPKGVYGYDWDEEDLSHVKSRGENK